MQMSRKYQIDLTPVKIGLGLVILLLLMNIALGAMFGLNEDMFQNFIHAGIAAHPWVFSNPDQAQEIIWRFVQRAHFHAGGIGAFTLGLIILTAISDMSDRRKKVTSILLGLDIFYPLAWYVVYLYAPSVGYEGAHHTILAELFTDIGVGALCLGLLSLIHVLFWPKQA
ncbi:hypothetical protein [Paludibacterium yongneupense]|uniref:hypothetical protein n=1 Tax=Paludibacterium yongneupense TaxID=400061 RepID=UPI00049022D6|nr:hypothetical protein [Paludibacterium yongneupense]